MDKTRVSLCMVIHSHQPVGNFDPVIEDAYQKSYLPFLQTLARYPAIRLSLHYSGILWSWIEAHHPEFLGLMRELTDRGQVEHVGGGFYEPILVAIPDAAKIAQIRLQRDFLEDRFGEAPRGVWVAERVWEQGLAAPLAKAGAEYVMLDDSHFLSAGEDEAHLHEAFLTEESGERVALIPSLQVLRYTIPFKDIEETLAPLRDGCAAGRRLFAVGDDCEKFGAWPGTYEHCYTNGWLDRFFQAIDAERDWLEATTISRFLAAHPPARRIYLPTASYFEMMTWALPPAAAGDFEQCLASADAAPDGARWRRFLRGAPWRNFFCKYPESNQLQKLGLRAFKKLESERDGVSGEAPCAKLDEAEKCLLASQCNDAYWHGFFGGLYAPHLRSAMFQRLIQAETILDRFAADQNTRIANEDFDVDGRSELLVESPAVNLVIRPADGGSVSSIRSKAAGADLINSLARRPEAYHREVRQNVEQRDITGQGAANGDTAALAGLLRYDKYSRHAFRTYLFHRPESWRVFQELRLGEIEDLAQGAWVVEEAADAPVSVRLRKCAEWDGDGERVDCLKTLDFSGGAGQWRIDCRHKLALEDPANGAWMLGVEIVLNLLAPSAPDRYICSGDERHPLSFAGELCAGPLILVDEWQGFEITLTAPLAKAWWVAPIETVSRSEAGFERIYQGSALMAVWNVGPVSAAYDLQLSFRSIQAAS